MSALFTPLKIGPMSITNRVFVSPMCQYSASEGCPGDWHLQHYGALAVGGAGALTIEATAVLPEGRVTTGCLGLYSDEQQAELAELIGYIRRLSPIRLGIQLNHAGRKGACLPPWDGGDGLREGGWPIKAPSAIPFGAGRAVPEQMDEAGMTTVEVAFADSARRALAVGLDYLELHLAHGYLLGSFLSPLANRRSDHFGGTLNNRMRFPLAAVAAVRAAWPADRALGVRINAHDWDSGGMSFAETLKVCVALRDVGVDFVCVSAGAVAKGVRIPAAPGYLLEFARRTRAATGLVTRAVGMLHQPRMAEQAVARGDADCVAIARAMLLDPRWAMKAAYALGADDLFARQFALASPDRWCGGRAVVDALDNLF